MHNGGDSLSIELQSKQVVGYVLIVIGLLLVGYIVFMANGLFSGSIDILDLAESFSSVDPETRLMAGVIIQIGMLGILVVAAMILIKYGLQICFKK